MSSEGSAGDHDWAWLDWSGSGVCLAAGLRLRVGMRDALVECCAPQCSRAGSPVHSLGTVTTTGTAVCLLRLNRPCIVLVALCGRDGR